MFLIALGVPVAFFVWRSEISQRTLSSYDRSTIPGTYTWQANALTTTPPPSPPWYVSFRWPCLCSAIAIYWFSPTNYVFHVIPRFYLFWILSPIQGFCRLPTFSHDTATPSARACLPTNVCPQTPASKQNNLIISLPCLANDLLN